jgi:glyoxylase-like metal-dependent hydrolase (beta-lactamase superfamily II)
LTPASALPAHVDAIARALGGRALGRVLVTHGHADHAAGVPVLRARWPALDARKFFARAERAAAEAAGWHALADGERVRAGDRDLVVLHTPGHAADHVCFWDPAARDLYAATCSCAAAPVMVPARRLSIRAAACVPIWRHCAGWRRSRRRACSPGHGPSSTHPSR